MFSSLFSILAQSEAGTGSDWNWLLSFIIFVVVVAVAMFIQTRFSAQEAAELAHASHHAEESHSQPSVVETEAEPEVVAAPPTPALPDDLKKIEGIGPKVADLLNENGITTFAQLAETPVDKLTAILDAAKLQMMQPDSWPQQAKLAAAADWETLQKLQDELKGGR